MLNMFSLEVFFFHYHSLPRSLSAIQRQQIAVIFSLSLPLWATLGENCLVCAQRDFNLENCDGTDFKMGAATTLPELSEWALSIIKFLVHLFDTVELFLFTLW